MFEGYPRGSITFLNQLSKNNNRQWFNDNKERYEQNVRFPSLTFIETIGPELKRQISECFTAIPKKVGGSLMRVYRDTRFSKDKTPYKTNVGIQFRHEMGKDVHAPGFYLHIERGNCFFGAGIWRPESKTLNKIREFLVDNPNAWKKLRDDKKFASNWELRGSSLIRPPKGFSGEHELIVDLKRKDFIAIMNFDHKEIYASSFVKYAIRHYKQSSELMAYLCMALELDY